MPEKDSYQKLVQCLAEDLDFQGEDSGYASHNFHSFPAKFPPQLPRLFIDGLTYPGDTVLDPMMGSGTTVVEAYLAGRQAVGFDIDPLAVLLSSTKVTPVDRREAENLSAEILHNAKDRFDGSKSELEASFQSEWDKRSREFIDYWFAKETQLELVALIEEISKIEDPSLRCFFELSFSSIIITKSGGVSLAFDLAHTRPHKAKVVIDRRGTIIFESDPSKVSGKRRKLLTKKLRSVFNEFEKRVEINLNSLQQPLFVSQSERKRLHAATVVGDAQNTPLSPNSIDLIVTSPPYASNAIDYMRAHKFSLVWLGHSISDLGGIRKEYIGGEATSDFEFLDLPKETKGVVAEISEIDTKKGKVLERYYSEMILSLREMHRVLKPRKVAIVVVGTSIMRGRDVQIPICLKEIGENIGFDVPEIAIRNIDRNRRMLPAGNKLNLESQIQQRMHEEYVIGFYKP